MSSSWSSKSSNNQNVVTKNETGINPLSSINGDSTSDQIIIGGNHVTVTTVNGVTTISSTGGGHGGGVTEFNTKTGAIALTGDLGLDVDYLGNVEGEEQFVVGLIGPITVTSETPSFLNAFVPNEDYSLTITNGATTGGAATKSSLILANGDYIGPPDPDLRKLLTFSINNAGNGDIRCTGNVNYNVPTGTTHRIRVNDANAVQISSTNVILYTGNLTSSGVSMDYNCTAAGTVHNFTVNNQDVLTAASTGVTIQPGQITSANNLVYNSSTAGNSHNLQIAGSSVLSAASTGVTIPPGNITSSANLVYNSSTAGNSHDLQVAGSSVLSVANTGVTIPSGNITSASTLTYNTTNSANTHNFNVAGTTVLTASNSAFTVLPNAVTPRINFNTTTTAGQCLINFAAVSNNIGQIRAYGSTAGTFFGTSGGMMFQNSASSIGIFTSTSAPVVLNANNSNTNPTNPQFRLETNGNVNITGVTNAANANSTFTYSSTALTSGSAITSLAFQAGNPSLNIGTGSITSGTITSSGTLTGNRLLRPVTEYVSDGVLKTLTFSAALNQYFYFSSGSTNTTLKMFATNVGAIKLSYFVVINNTTASITVQNSSGVTIGTALAQNQQMTLTIKDTATADAWWYQTVTLSS